MLGVAAVRAHVPLQRRALRAGNGIGAADERDEAVAGLPPGARRSLEHAPERLVPEDQALLAGRSGTVGALDDLVVGAVHADRERLHQDRALLGRRFRNLEELCAPLPLRNDRNRSHRVLPSSPPAPNDRRARLRCPRPPGAFHRRRRAAALYAHPGDTGGPSSPLRLLRARDQKPVDLPENSGHPLGVQFVPSERRAERGR